MKTGSCGFNTVSAHIAECGCWGGPVNGVCLHELAFGSVVNRFDAEVPNRRSEQGWEKSQYRWSVGCTAANACRWPSTPAPCPGQELMGRAPYIDAHTACGHVDHAPTGHRVNPWTTHSVAHRLPLGPHPHWLLPQLLHIHTTDHTSLSKPAPEPSRRALAHPRALRQAQCERYRGAAARGTVNLPRLATLDAGHVVGERMRVHRDFGMGVRSEPLRAFDADRAIAERGAFSRAGNDADVLRHANPRPISRRPDSGRARRVRRAAARRAARSVDGSISGPTSPADRGVPAAALRADGSIRPRAVRCPRPS